MPNSPSVVSNHRIISVCMATYNANHFFQEQMDSILSQQLNEGDKLEVVLSDDSTNDNTLRMVEAYHDERIVYFRHTNRKQFRYYNNLRCATQNFENAIRFSRGEIIFLSDQDDIWYPGRIKAMVDVLDGTKKHFVSSSFHWMYNGKVFSKTIMRPLSLIKILSHSGIFGFSCAFTREFADYILPFHKVHQYDTYLGALAVRNQVAVFDERIMAAHRCYPEQTSNSGFHEPLWIKVLFRCRLIFSVIFKRKLI